MKLLQNVLLFVFVFQSSVAVAAKPNIVFLFADDQNTLSMGCYGNTDVQTPHLDQLAHEGIVFDNHYDTTAICMASRANVMTGMYEYKTGCNFGTGNMQHAHWMKSYPMLLRQAGYRTAIAGKIGFVVELPDGKRGKAVLPKDDFDKWGAGPGQTNYATKKNPSMAQYAEEFPHSTRSYGAFGRDFIAESAKAGQPFCLSISFKAPHKPATPDPKFDHVYAGKIFKKPGNYGREFGKHFSEQSRQGRQYSRWSEWKYDTDYDGQMAIYHQQVYGIDVAVGMVRDALKENGVEDNTFVIYTSDNGFLCGSHGYGSKVLPYEESSRVPLIMFDPRHSNTGKQLRCRALTGNIDFAPTILELAGLPIPNNVDGKSLLPLYDDPTTDIRDSLALINVWGPIAVHSFGVMTKDWKYIYWPYAANGLEATEELFNTHTDPLELISRMADVDAVKTMRDVYDRTLADWKRDSIKTGGYTKYGVVFDRSADWKDKQSLFSKKQSQQATEK